MRVLESTSCLAFDHPPVDHHPLVPCSLQYSTLTSTSRTGNSVLSIKAQSQ